MTSWMTNISETLQQIEKEVDYYKRKAQELKKATRSAASALFLPRLAYVCPNVTKFQDDQFYVCRKLHIFAYIHILLSLVLANISGY